jgi:hypothetical protein
MITAAANPCPSAEEKSSIVCITKSKERRRFAKGSQNSMIYKERFCCKAQREGSGTEVGGAVRPVTGFTSEKAIQRQATAMMLRLRRACCCSMSMSIKYEDVSGDSASALLIEDKANMWNKIDLSTF